MDTNVGVSVTEEGEIDEAKGNFSRNLETVVQSSEKNGLQKCNDKGAENDLNALDYEAELVLIEPEMRSNDSSMKKNNCGNGKDKSSDEIELETKKDSKKQHSDLRNHRSRKSDSRSYSRERPHSKRGERQKTISTRRRYSPYRGNDRTGTYRTYRERRHHSRSTSRSHRFRRRDSRYVKVDPKQIKKSNDLFFNTIFIIEHVKDVIESVQKKQGRKVAHMTTTVR